MAINPSTSRLNPKKRYLQVALNSTLEDAHAIIRQLPRNERIIVEAGTPLIKRYGTDAISKIRTWYQSHLWGIASPIGPAATSRRQPTSALEMMVTALSGMSAVRRPAVARQSPAPADSLRPYIVADMKMMDRGSTEVQLAADAGADAVIALGLAPIESLDTFISQCEAAGVDSMIDMMNVDFPLAILRKLKKQPTVVILHRGVDETQFNKDKMLPLHEIRRIKGNYDLLIAVAGGDTVREVQRAIFNDADIVIVWKEFYHGTSGTADLASRFLAEVK